MRESHEILARLLVLSLALSGCTLIDVRTDPELTGLESDAFIDGYATLGWAHDPSFFEVRLFDGRSNGSLFMLDLWYIARVEIGLLGISAGVGPFDAGIGLFFYDPRSPASTRAPHTWRGHSHRREHASHEPDPDWEEELDEALEQVDEAFEELDEALEEIAGETDRV